MVLASTLTAAGTSNPFRAHVAPASPTTGQMVDLPGRLRQGGAPSAVESGRRTVGRRRRAVSFGAGQGRRGGLWLDDVVARRVEAGDHPPMTWQAALLV